MKVEEVLSKTRDAVTVKRVYGDPYEKDGVTVIPAAAVKGGAGGGSGHDEKGQEGEGGGFGVTGRPAGAFVVKDGQVKWLPAIDPNRLFLTIGAIVIAYVLTRPRLAKFRNNPH